MKYNWPLLGWLLAEEKALKFFKISSFTNLANATARQILTEFVEGS